MGRHGAVHDDARTCSRTSATARSSTPARWRSARRCPPAPTSPTRSCYNRAVAMTGGQDAAGATPVPDADAHPRGRGRQAHHRHDRRAREVPARGPLGPGRRGVASRPARRGAARAARHPRRDRARSTTSAAPPRSAACASAASCRSPADARVHQRGGLRGLRRLRREVELPQRAAGRDRVRPQDADPPVVLQQGLLLPARRLPVVRDHRPARRDEEEERKALHGRPRAARAGAARAAATPTST